MSKSNFAPQQRTWASRHGPTPSVRKISTFSRWTPEKIKKVKKIEEEIIEKQFCIIIESKKKNPRQKGFTKTSI